MQYLEKLEAGGKLYLAIFGSRLLSDGNSFLCQLILRNSARFSVMSASIHRYMCLSTALTDGPLIKNNRKGSKNYLCRNFFLCPSCRHDFFFWGFRKVSGYRGVWTCLEELHKLYIFFCYICLSVKKQLLVNIRHCL